MRGWPRSFLALAVVIAAARGVLGALGGLPNVSFFSGTMPVTPSALALGLAFAGAHFAFVLAAPVFAIAAVLGLGARALGAARR